MSQASHRTAGWIAAFGVCVALSGCVREGLAFKVDDRLTFTSPADRGTVALPVKLAWEIRDFDITAPGVDVRNDAGYFGVFVDTTPMPPGKPLKWLARDDDSCREADGCPDEQYLNVRGIYTTTATELVLQQLPRTTDKDRRERHRATIVLLDATGTRIGESAFEIVFDVDRRKER